jgi:hypothetical protein
MYLVACDHPIERGVVYSDNGAWFCKPEI